MNRTSNPVVAREQPVGGLPKKNPGKKFVLNGTDFMDSESASPFPIFWGTVRIAGIAITPVFNLKTKDAPAEGGK